ncbi:uncharacterized protein LOC130424925 [Triplophysa dalaica]|uniref:uncharacterized protein LOC130424925 n=1 Tax=Triplophysa dalaica TaxID=1582913 RepID=UPI0024DFD1E5|nr:uncharacterized protein LOC130424925 [Triplophysa dalaica]
MDPVIYQQIVSYKCHGKYPDGLCKNEKNSFRKKANLFEIEDGKLYYVRYKSTPKAIKTEVVLGIEEANRIFAEFHNSDIGAHTGQNKTRYAISKRFYWPGMSQDIDKWVAQCGQCQASSTSVKEGTAYTPIVVNQPFELLGMDLIGKLTLTDNGNQYICVIIDYLTKWPQAYPLKSKSAIEVTQCLINFVHQFEAPKRVLTDQGTEFVNQLNRHVCSVLNIQRSLCAPYHPQTNGLVERMNATIQRALCKLVKDQPKNWDRHLDAVMFAICTKKQMTTKFSPYFLMFGREARYPSEIPEHYRINHSMEETISVEKVTESAIKLSETLLEAGENIKKSQKKIQKKCQSLISKFKVGDKVWRQNVRTKQRKGGKLDANFLGPFTITSLEGKSADLENGMGVKIPKINIDHLKPYCEESPRVPHKIQKPSTISQIKGRPISSQQTPAPQIPGCGHHSSPISSAPQTPDRGSLSSPLSLKPQTPDLGCLSLPLSSAPQTPDRGCLSSSVKSAPKSPDLCSLSSPLSSTPQTPDLGCLSLPLSSAPQTPDHGCLSSSVKSAPKSPDHGCLSSSVKSAPNSPDRGCLSSSVKSVPKSRLQISPASNASLAPKTPISGINIETCVREAWKGKNVNVLLAKIGPFKLFYADIHRTAPTMELESEVMNAFVYILVRKFNESSQDRAASIDSYEMSNIWIHKRAKVKMDPRDYKYIIGIINHCHHWTLTVMIPQEKRALYLDPMGESQNNLNRCQDVTRSFMRQKGFHISRWVCGTLPHPLQSDCSSCGAFVLKFAECVLEEKPIEFSASQDGVEDLRMNIATCLLEKTDNLKDLCYFCGEHNTGSDWIGCDVCPRWFHTVCAKTSVKVSSFICPACWK